MGTTSKAITPDQTKGLGRRGSHLRVRESGQAGNSLSKTCINWAMSQRRMKKRAWTAWRSLHRAGLGARDRSGGQEELERHDGTESHAGRRGGEIREGVQRTRWRVSHRQNRLSQRILRERGEAGGERGHGKVAASQRKGGRERRSQARRRGREIREEVQRTSWRASHRQNRLGQRILRERGEAGRERGHGKVAASQRKGRRERRSGEELGGGTKRG